MSKCSLACDMVKLKILESQCLPILLYGSESGIFDDHVLTMLNCCWNSVYRRIFGYFRWESVRNVMSALNKLNVLHLVNLRRILFVKNSMNAVFNNNTWSGIIKMYRYVNRNEFQSILNRFETDMSMSVKNINKHFHIIFANTCHD